MKELCDKRVALLGFGLENRSLGKYLATHGIPFSVCDARLESEFPEKHKWNHIVENWHFGTTYLDHLDNFDVAFRTPGINAQHPRLVGAQVRGVSIQSQTRFFFKHCPSPIVGITGTKGKGTTCSLLFELLREGPYEKVWLGGNIGRPPVEFLDDLGISDLVILELSSFQLQDLDRSPHVSVVLTVTSDHLDYHGIRRDYVEAKKNICRFQRKTDKLIVNADCQTATQFRSVARSCIMEFSSHRDVPVGAFCADGSLWVRELSGNNTEICEIENLSLRGGHNVANALAAVAAAVAIGADDKQLTRGLGAFSGLEHRLEYVATVAEVEYYNDSLATMPDATIAALNSFDSPILLIAGGSSKGADFSDLAEAIVCDKVKGLVLLKSDEGGHLYDTVLAAGFKGDVMQGCPGMEEAVIAAQGWATPGDVVLLSPACASFGMFNSYEERGTAFKNFVMSQVSI